MNASATALYCTHTTAETSHAAAVTAPHARLSSSITLHAHSSGCAAYIVVGVIKKLFEGHNMKYVECVNVHYISIKKQTFSCLQLDVKGCRSVYASFDKYTEVERLEGDSRYRAGPHGLQDAEKRLMFIDFPLFINFS
ncbi:putative ubiquitinyl hydrolase 1 [Helianthus anomalus]